MKRIAFLLASVAVAGSFASAAPVLESQPVISAKGPHHRVWTKTIEETRPNGKKVNRTSSYTELSGGLHYWSAEQKDWVEASADIEIVNGFAVARRGQLQVIWNPNCNSPGAMDVQSTLDGKRFRSHVLGLAFTDAKTGASMFFANLKDCVGEVAGSSIIYRDAFDSISGDIVYVYERGKLEQNIVLKQGLPDPAQPPFNMDPSTVRVEVYTEFLEAPQPKVNAFALKAEGDPGKRVAMVEPDLIDQHLNFGATLIGSGSAFTTGLGNDEDQIPVAKVFELREQRQVLVERVEYPAIFPKLALLQQAAALPKERIDRIEAALVADRNGIRKSRLPKAPVLAAKAGSTPMRVALALAVPKGLVLDYSQLVTITNGLLKGDTTYYISGSVSLTGPFTIEGGVVIKYAPTNSAKIQLNGAVNFLTGPYRMAVFTARDDHTIGEQIGTNTLSGYYASYALDLNGFSINFDIPYVRISYANVGIHFFGGASHLLSHSQLVKCNTGYVSYYTDVKFRNVLGYSINTFCSGTGVTTTTSRWEHVTLDQVQNWNNSYGSMFWATNCALVAVTNNANYWTGANNASTNSSANAFQIVGAANHYLLTNSPFRDAGTTNIDQTLAAQLKQKTTYPPVVFTNSIGADTTFDVSAQRDGDTVDLGYHYDPIDFAVHNVGLSNATLTVQPGTVVAGFGDYSALVLNYGAVVAAEGSPTNLIRFVTYHTAQEQATTNWSTIYAPALLTAGTTDGSPVVARLRFTDWSSPGGERGSFRGSCDGALSSSFRDSQFHGGTFGTYGATLHLTNCLFDRVGVTITEDSGGALDWHAYNNTFYGGSLLAEHVDSGTWRIRNNLFDKTAITCNWNVDSDYCGYITNASRLAPNGSYDIIQTSSTNIGFETSWLGRFYLPTNSVFVNKGNTNANYLRLYHYTVLTNQIPETNTIVDIGYHSIAVDGNGQPLDGDGDGLFNFLEDLNGNGSIDTGETDWTASDTDLDGVSDYLETLLGRNALVAGTTNDVNGTLNLRVYTPLK